MMDWRKDRHPAPEQSIMFENTRAKIKKAGPKKSLLAAIPRIMMSNVWKFKV
jgi:hypothetical protein